MNYPDLLYQISSRLGVPVTPAQARTLYARDPSDKGEQELDWLIDALTVSGIDSSKVSNFSAIDASHFRDVGYLVHSGQSYLFMYDDSSESIIFVNQSQKEEIINFGSFIKKFNLNECELIYLFSLTPKESYAALPGVETHWFFAPIWRNRGLLFQASLASLITNLLALGTSMFSLVVYNKIIPAKAMDSLIVLLLGMLLVIVSDYLVKVARSKFISIMSSDADLIIAERLFVKIIDLSYVSKKSSVGSLANTLKEYEHIREFITSAALIAIIDLPFSIIFIALIIIIGGWMVVPVVLGILIITLVSIYIQPRLKKIAETSHEDSGNKHSVLVETLSGLETIKLLGAGGLMRGKFRKVLNRQSVVSDESKSNTNFATNVIQEVQQSVQIGVIAVGAFTVSGGMISFGAIMACSILAGKAMMPFAQLAQLLLRLNQVVTGYKALNQFMNEPSEHKPDITFLARGRLVGGVEFSEVSFAYPGQEGKALESVSFKIEPGERVAIVGRVGSGKSTIGKIIAKLYEANSGSVYLDKIDILQLDPSEVRENMGYVSQEPWLISGTLEENISLGSSFVSSDDVLWAAELSGVSDFINKSPKGFKLMVKERGEGLSGGQKQCISIARALVRRPPILVFDEPTSAMDSKTENNFIQAFKNNALKSTLILITHRTSLLSLVDRVIIVDNGKVIGSGKADSFLAGRSVANSDFSASPLKTS